MESHFGENIFIIICFIFLWIGESFEQTSCTTNGGWWFGGSRDYTGDNDPDGKTGERDTETGTAILINHGEFQFQCCGFVHRWEFYAEMAGSIDAQVWRLDSGNSYTLVGSNTITADNPNNLETEDIATGSRIRVNDGDYIVLHSTTDFIITHEKEDGPDNRKKLTDITTSMTINTVYDWSSADDKDEDYAIRAYVTDSERPTVSNLLDISMYNDEVIVGAVLNTVIVSDNDPEDVNNLTVAIDSASNGGITYFDIVAGSYDITVKANPPVGKYNLQIKVEDPCGWSSTTTNKITIINRLPVINNLPESIYISEDTGPGILLYTINATDTVTDPVICSMTGVNSNEFSVSQIFSTTDYGVYIKNPGVAFDYDAKSTYAVNVQCDDGTDSVSAELTVNLIRNEPPVIHSLPTSVSLSEDIDTRTLLHTINVTDPTGDNVTCSLNPTSNSFYVSAILPSSTEDYGIFLKSGIALNYDTTSSYTLTIYCADHRRSDTETLTVNIIRNEPPTITNLPMSREISEDTVVETLLYTVYVTDPTNDTVTCSITTATTMFYIQSGSTLFEADIKSRVNQGFNYDTQRQYTLDISCEDQRRSDSSVLYIYLLRNNPPYFTNLQGMTLISSKTAFIGQSVFTVSGEDPEKDQLQFSITPEDVNAPFTINKNTGEISLTRSIMAESTPAYDLFVIISDGRNTVGPRSLTVRIEDINYPPILRNLPQTLSVLEGVNIRKNIFSPEVEDEDLSDDHLFSASFSPADGAIYFKVNETNGIVTIKADIDYETISSKTFVITLTVSDSFMEDTERLTLNIVNVNEPPRFTKRNYQLTTTENSAGTDLQNPYYQYEDEDGDNVKFSFDCGIDTGRLDIDSATGVVSFSVVYDLDKVDTASEIGCDLYISDNKYTDTAFLNITVSDENDNTPSFTHSQYTFFVSPETAIGTIIGQVQATDDDIGVFGNFLYHIAQEDFDNGIFKVSQDGSITIGQSLTDYPTGSVLKFTTYAVDTDGKQDSTHVSIVLPASSVETTTTTDTIEYFTFFTYAPNMAWFVPLMFALLITAIVVMNTIYKGHCTCSCPKSGKGKRKIRRRKRRVWIEESHL